MKMQHPEIKAAADVLSREQFNTIYAARGWVLMTPDVEYANDQLGRFVATSDDLTKDEARALIASRGGEYPDADATEADVKASYAEMFVAPAPRPSPETATAAGIPIKLYDPAEHPVNASADGKDLGVLAYLGSATDDERQRVLELEEARGDQARTTVLNWSPPADNDSTPVDDQDKE